MKSRDVSVKLAEYHKEIGSLKHRMQKCEEQTELWHKLASSIDKLAVNMKHMAEEQRAQGLRLEKLEHEPADEFKQYKRLIVGCIISSSVSMLLGALVALLV